MAEAKFSPDIARKALEAGDSKTLAKLVEDGWNDRAVESINPQIKKFVARAIMELAKYEIPEVVKTSTNKTVSALENIKKLVAATASKEVLAEIEKQIADAGSSTFAASDGVQKGWQAFVLDCISERLVKLKLPKAAEAIKGAMENLVKYGNKRPETKKEKAERIAAKAADTEEEEA